MRGENDEKWNKKKEQCEKSIKRKEKVNLKIKW
jgi:hypothetical protein